MAKMKPKEVKDRVNFLQGERKTWEHHWRELADFFFPMRNDILQEFSPGQKRNTHLLNNTGMISNELLAGALHGLLTNPNTQWFDFATGDPELDEKDSVKEWLQDSAQRTLHVLNNSNFQTEVVQYYLDLGALCTAAFLVEEDSEFVVRFGSEHIKNVYIEEDAKGKIVKVYRVIKWNAEQVIGEFGSKAVTDGVVKAWKDNSPHKFTIFHAIYPNTIDKDGGDRSAKNTKKPFISQWVLDGEGSANIIDLKVSGFNELPYIVARWAKASGEKYGRGPGTTALPEMKIVNKMTETIIKASQKVVDPPLQAPDDGFVFPLRTTPGGLNYYRAGTQDRIEPIFNDARIDVGFQALEAHQVRIREAFFVDQLQLAQGPQMTATEVLQRTEEKMRLLGPLLGRQQHEFLRPLIDRVFGIMSRRGLYKPAPEEIQGKVIDVNYSSVIARAQKAGEINNMLRTVELISPVIQAKPDAMDIIDEDKFVREVIKLQNFPQRAVRSKAEIEELRGARAEAQEELIQQQQEAQAAENAAKNAQAVGQVINQ